MDENFADLLRAHLPFLEDRQLTADSNLRALGLDSMRAIALLFTIEDSMGVSLRDEDLNDATFETPGALWKAVRASEREETLPGAA